jgi:uncharacterized protein YbaR (Trm112 family)
MVTKYVLAFTCLQVQAQQGKSEEFLTLIRAGSFRTCGPTLKCGFSWPGGKFDNTESAKRVSQPKCSFGDLATTHSSGETGACSRQCRQRRQNREVEGIASGKGPSGSGSRRQKSRTRRIAPGGSDEANFGEMNVAPGRGRSMDCDCPWTREKIYAASGAEGLHMSANQFLSSLLTCPQCKARGALTWEKAKGDLDEYSSLVRISGGFHIEEERTTAISKTIVCTQCDEIYGPLPRAGKLPT